MEKDKKGKKKKREGEEEEEEGRGGKERRGKERGERGNRRRGGKGGGGRGRGRRDCVFWGFCSKVGYNTEPRTCSLLKLPPILPIPKVVEVGEKKILQMEKC